MILTVDTVKKQVQVKSNVSLPELTEYMQNQYGSDWVNYKIIPTRSGERNTFIENHYYSEPKYGWLGSN